MQTVRFYAVFIAVPLFWASVAGAQDAPEPSPSPEEDSTPTEEAESPSDSEGEEMDALGALLDDESADRRAEGEAPTENRDGSDPGTADDASTGGDETGIEEIRATAVADPSPAKSSEAERVDTGVEETMVGEITKEQENDLNNVLNGPGVGTTDKAWQVILATSTSLSSGAFVTLEPDSTPVFNNDVPTGNADRLGTLSQNFDARYQYNFTWGGESLRARARWLFNAEYTQPNSVSSERLQRFQPSDLAIDLTDMSIVKSEALGIVLGGVRFTLPTSRGSDFVDLKTELSAFATWVKPFSNGLLLFSGARAGWRIQDDVGGSCGFVETNPVSPTNPDALDGGGDCELGQQPVQEGSLTDDYVASWSVGAQYAATEKLTLSYSLSLFWTFGSGGAEDAFSGANADPGFDIQSSNYIYGASANYLLNDAVAAVTGELPFSLSGGFSISAFHPMTTSDNSPYLPLWYQAFSGNRGAENTVQMSLDLIASY